MNCHLDTNHGNDWLSIVPNSGSVIFIFDQLSQLKNRASLIMNQVKFPKPKIMLIDCEEQISIKLKEVGYSVCQGTFGSPYQVSLNDAYSPVVDCARLDSIEEQEVIVIDTSLPEQLPYAPAEKATSLGTEDFWAGNNTGQIDPRPRAMIAAADAVDRILKHGGILIVFSEPRIRSDFWLGAGNEYGRVTHGREITLDNYCFSQVLGNDAVVFSRAAGVEVSAVGQSNLIAKVLAKYACSCRYSATMEKSWQLQQESWFPLLENKYGQCVAAAILDEESKSVTMLLPHFHDKAQVLCELLKRALPQLRPALFCYDDAFQWLHTPDYEHPRVLDIREQQKDIERKATEQIAVLESEARAESERLAYLHGILTKQGDELVLHVQTALEALGFSHVIDADTQIQDGAPKQEDLQILDRSPTMLVEVKGLNGLPTEGDTFQVVKYIPRRMKEWSRTDVIGMVVINHQMSIPPSSRDHKNVFTAQQVEDAKHHDILLITSYELFRLIRAKQAYSWNSSDLLDMFYRSGRLNPIPKHWKPLGKIVNYRSKNSERDAILSIELSCDLGQGTHLGLLLDDRYLEMQVSSIGLDGVLVNAAGAGKVIGVPTTLSRSESKLGTIIYRVDAISANSNA